MGRLRVGFGKEANSLVRQNGSTAKVASRLLSVFPDGGTHCQGRLLTGLGKQRSALLHPAQRLHQHQGIGRCQIEHALLTGSRRAAFRTILAEVFQKRSLTRWSWPPPLRHTLAVESVLASSSTTSSSSTSWLAKMLRIKPSITCSSFRAGTNIEMGVEHSAVGLVRKILRFCQVRTAGMAAKAHAAIAMTASATSVSVTMTPLHVPG